ncbi:MAG: hypothetical protein KGL38_04880 [Gemmatimonadota bacterium]|nr:hypothetical protein [Gemmatimonadota bacterium]
MSRKLAAAALLALAALAGCTDRAPTATSPIGGPHIAKSTTSGTLGACTTLTGLINLANEVFGAGSPNVQSVIGKLDNLDHFVQIGDTADAQSQAQNIVGFVQQKAAQGTLPGTSQQIDTFIGSVLCYAGLSPNTYLIQPTDNAQVLTSNTGNSGVSLQAHTVSVPTLLTITEQDPNGPSGLVTKLDQYPTFIAITVSSQLLDSAVVAVCIPASLGVTADVFARLRLGHQASTGFEITPPADPSFLGCPTSVASASKLPKWLRDLASLVLPRPLYAGTMMYATGGVGGSAINFSPFGAVDNGLYATGGVGGTAINFQRAPSASRAPGDTTATGKASKPTGSSAPAYSVYDANGNCVSSDTTAGVALDPLCRPVITIKTAKGTIMTSVPVTWAVTAGGGTIASDTLSDGACGPFASSASNATDVNGQAGVCWTLGPVPGSNTVTATPAFGGDAPQGVVFLNSAGNAESGVQFTATGDLIPTTATATAVTATYDGTAHLASGSCSNSLTPAYTYGTTGGSAPVNGGTYSFTVTCGAGSSVYAVSTASSTITITPAPTTTTLSCSSQVYTGSPVGACTATATGPAGLSAAVTPVAYTNNVNVGTAGASATFLATANYQTSTGTATFAITKAASATAVTCPATVAYTGSAQTPCAATATGAGGLSASVAVTYTPTPVRDAGAYTAGAAYAGDANHLGSSGHGTFTVSQLPATATAGSNTMLYNGAVPAMPCLVSGLLSADAGSVTCTTSVPATLVPGVNVTTPVVTPASPVDYAMTLVNGALAVRYVQNGCFASPIYSSQPPTKSYQKLGSNLPIKCALLDANGNAVTNATGGLQIVDMGTGGGGPGTVVFTLANAFQQQQNKNYSYGFDTSILTSGHYYMVNASWNDGSTTTGWFYVK